ncbi:GIY-YIG nuclease family protein [Aeromonas veronii]
MEIKVETTSISGVFKVTSQQWDGVIFKIPRDKYEDWKEHGEQPETASIYALYADHFDRMKHGNDLYIGQSGDIQQRLDQHCTNKNFWSIVLIFSSSNDWMNIAHTKNIEFKFIELAKKANRFNVLNGNDGAPTHLGSDDKIKVAGYIEPIIKILKMIGVDIFEFNMDGLYTFEKKHPFKKGVLKSEIRVLDPQRKLLEIIRGGEFLVYSTDNLRNKPEIEIVERNIIKIIKTHTITLENQIVHTIYGQSLSNWKSKTGVSLSDYLRSCG